MRTVILLSALLLASCAHSGGADGGPKSAGRDDIGPKAGILAAEAAAIVLFGVLAF